MLELKNISVQFGGIKALTDVSFKVEKNSLFSIIGPNGAGKTTLLNIISGRYKPLHGDLYYEGKNLTQLHPNKRASLGIGRTFQNLALFNHMTVLENIFIGLSKFNFKFELFDSVSNINDKIFDSVSNILVSISTESIIRFLIVLLLNAIMEIKINDKIIAMKYIFLQDFRKKMIETKNNKT